MQPMSRPDQAKFEEFVKPLVQFDPIWERFTNQGEYALEKNPLRQPGRILRRGSREHPGNPAAIICLAMDTVWHQVDYRDDLPYALSVRAYFEGPEPDFTLSEFVEDIASSLPLLEIGVLLPELLGKAVDVLKRATPEYIIQQGRQVENLRRRYERGKKPGGIEPTWL
jgi:hypothetical protein